MTEEKPGRSATEARAFWRFRSGIPGRPEGTDGNLGVREPRRPLFPYSGLSVREAEPLDENTSLEPSESTGVDEVRRIRLPD